jgi:hypothetical protein
MHWTVYIANVFSFLKSYLAQSGKAKLVTGQVISKLRVIIQVERHFKGPGKCGGSVV